ncbi:MAG TPA: tetratricopeptide repeat protein [Chiayiivirga sp.]|nr:tetratricopeptide repeat protein [Chiayiivirga sp.]
MPRLLVYLLLAALVPVCAWSSELQRALEPLMQGEFALQEGRLSAAADAYARAADESTDPEIAERAAQVALLAKDAVLARRALARWEVLAPQDENASVGRLRLALLESDATAAQPLLAALLEREDGWRKAAAALIGAPDPEVARALAAHAFDQSLLPRDIDAWLAFGGVALRLQDKALYSRLAQAVAGVFPDAPRALAWQAEDALDRGDRAGARRALDAALILPNLTLVERLVLATQLGALDDPAAAAQALVPAGDDDRALAARADYLSRAGDEAGLKALYDEALAGMSATKVPDARLMLMGQLAEIREDPAAAMAWYRQIREGLLREQARLRIAILLDKTGERAAAQSLLREIQTSDSEWGDTVRDAYLLEAELARTHGDVQAEIAALDRGLVVFEDDAALRYNRALAYERADRVDDAVADLRALVEAQPEDPDYLNGLGYTLVDRTDALEEGLTLIRKAFELKPDSAAIIDSLGWALHRLGRNEEALPHIRRAFELQRDAEVGAHLAAVLAALGQSEEARSVLRLAQELDPDNRAVRQVREALGE